MIRRERKHFVDLAVSLFVTVLLACSFSNAAGATTVPTLGVHWNLNGGLGYGNAKPRTISNGGDPTGIASAISWQSWGGARAIGTGKSDWVAPGKGIANGSQETVTVIAFHLGICQGHAAYRALEWYFPEHGQSFHENTYINACTGAYIYPPATCSKSQMTSAFRAYGSTDFVTIWLACKGNWAVAGGYSQTVGFSVGLLNYIGGAWIFIDAPSDGTCMLDFRTTAYCDYSPPPTLPIPYATFRTLVTDAGMKIVEGGTTVTTPLGWEPPVS